MPLDQAQTPTMAQWRSMYEDRNALIQSPEAHQFALDEMADALFARSMISADELGFLVEQAEAAYQWGVEEQLTVQLCQIDIE